MWVPKRLSLHLLFCALCLYCLIQICESIHQQKEIAVKDTETTSCFHNNTIFADTSLIPSTEPCLRCKCTNKSIVCVRKVCKDQPYPPPRSCVLVQKKSLCCSYLLCSKNGINPVSSKYHINFYKNSERNYLNHLEMNREKIFEKSTRTDDGEETNGGSAMVKSSTSMCSYCYCINGRRKCINPKCMLHDTSCKPIFMDGSCCPIKYNCEQNTSVSHHYKEFQSQNELTKKRRNRSNGCYEEGVYFQEGEKLPENGMRPCEMCYCIKGFRKCVVKKCAPMIRGCVPQIKKEGNCCPTSYDCSRSLKTTRQTRQNNEEELEEDNDSIDFFSLLFGSEEPQDDKIIDNPEIFKTTTLQPFKLLPSTEKSFFDLIRAGLEIIDANADKIDTRINTIVATPKNASDETLERTTVRSKTSSETSTEKFVKTTLEALSNFQSVSTGENIIKLKDKIGSLPSKSTTLASIKSTATMKTSSSTQVTSRTPSVKTDSTTKFVVSSATLSPLTKTKATVNLIKKDADTTVLHITTQNFQPSSTKTTAWLRTTTPKANLKTTKRNTETAKTTPKFASTKIKITTTEAQDVIYFNAGNLPDIKTLKNSNNDDEAETLPNIEIIPFVAHDAIDTAPYLNPQEILEKDYFANNKEKPFRYNNKFSHQSYEDSSDYVFPSNKHERIDSGPYYFESNDNQFDSFSPPSEKDFLGGFSPKENIYNEVFTMASKEKPFRNYVGGQELFDASTIRKTKPHVTLQSIIKQTTQNESKQSTVPDFKKISANFTSFIDDLLHTNALVKTTTKISTTIATTATPISTSDPIEPIINDDEFIMKHLKAHVIPMKTVQGLKTEIFSKPTAATMNGLLKLAGCNIYGKIFNVGSVIEELSSECLECKCLPDIGVGCAPKC